MSEVGDVLELLHGAHRRYRTVRVVAREWRHNHRLLAAYNEAMRASGAAGLVSTDDDGVPAETTVVLRVWFEQPNRIREEREEDGRLSAGVSDGSRWWTVLPDWATIGEEGDGWARGNVGQTTRSLLDPARLPGILELEPRGRQHVAGRDALVVEATPRPGILADDLLLGTGADRHELAVDAERGTLLRVESSRAGEPFFRLEVDELAFDEPIDPERFTHDAAPGEKVLGLAESVGEHVSLEEAARRASFPVLVPAGLGRGWRLHVLYTPGAEGSRLRETATLSFYRDDASQSVSIRQTAPPFERWQLNGTEEVEEDGRTLRVAREGWRRVLLERDGAAVELSSATVEVDELVALALALSPAATERPSLLP